MTKQSKTTLVNTFFMIVVIDYNVGNIQSTLKTAPFWSVDDYHHSTTLQSIISKFEKIYVS